MGYLQSLRSHRVVDVRRDHPFAAYGDLRFDVPVFESVGVSVRTLARMREVRESVSQIQQPMAHMPEGPPLAPLSALPAFEPAYGIVEGWRGASVQASSFCDE